VVTDAPYGVQHGSRAAARLTRSPQDLLAAAVPVWARLLRPGGAVGIAWNTLVAPRTEAAAILAAADLHPVEHGPYLNFRHRVDQAIVRDVLVARKPSTEKTGTLAPVPGWARSRRPDSGRPWHSSVAHSSTS
jgi:hypothetical protein